MILTEDERRGWMKDKLREFLGRFPMATDEQLNFYHAGLVDGMSWRKRKCIMCQGLGKVRVWHPGDPDTCMQCDGTGIDVLN